MTLFPIATTPRPSEPPAAQGAAPTLDLDRMIHTQIARLTMGLSPASMAAACLDWLGHLAVSPGKQQALAVRAMRGVAEGAATEPRGKDRRFAAPEWQQRPFNRIAQTFLQHERWWLDATTTGVHGVSAHHEQQVGFMARQMLDMWSPSNFLWTNPEVLQTTLKSGGANLSQGAQNQWHDTTKRLLNGPASTVSKGFEPGKDVAITPGKVVFRNHLIALMQYTPQTPTVFAGPMLIVPPWIMKFYILDLTPADSLVRYLVEHGHTVFIVSWLNPSAADRDLGMDDYLKSGVMAAVDAVASLAGKKGLIVGIANEQSIAFGCAQVMRELGGAIAVTYMNAKAEPCVRPLADRLGAEIIAPLDVEQPGQMEAVFAQIAQHWGRLDFLLHAIAHAPAADLHGRMVDSSTAGFARAMDISCHSFVRLARLAEPLMKDGGALLTMSYYGAQKVIPNYGIMGAVKAALEATVRYLAAELGLGGIRVHAVSPGPIKARAASGIGEFEKLLDDTASRAPEHQRVTIADVGAVTALLRSEAARAMTGNVVFVDAGYHVMG